MGTVRPPSLYTADKFRTVARLVLIARSGGAVARILRSLTTSLVLVCFLTISHWAGTAAYAFDLVTADPAINTTVKTAPSAITLTFSSDVTDTGSSLSVRAPSGTAVDDGSLLIDGKSALIGLKKLSEGGKYTITYQLMSVDGEMLSGTYSFTYEAPAEISSPTPAASTSATTPSTQTSDNSPAQATGKSSRATDIFMISLLIISFVVLVVISRSLRKSKPKRRKKK